MFSKKLELRYLVLVILLACLLSTVYVFVLNPTNIVPEAINRFFRRCIEYLNLVIIFLIFVQAWIVYTTNQQKNYVHMPYIQQILIDKEEAESKQMEAEERLSEIEKKLSRRVFEAHEQERQRVARELHDGIGQFLYSILVTLNATEKEQSPEKKAASLQTVKMLTNNALLEVKSIAQSLRPSTLDDLGFIPALRSYLEAYKQIYSIPVKLDISGDIGRLKPEIETALYRICQEALTNSAKHANPHSIHVSIHINQNEIQLMIKDDGDGFHFEEYVKNEQRNGIGLYSMRERAEGVGGTFQLQTKARGGTTITISIPKN